MATLFVCEYNVESWSAPVALPASPEPAVATQKITFTTSTASAAFGATTRYVRVIADADFYFAFGAAPTAATTSGAFMKANTVEYFRVNPGDKVAAVTAV